MTDSGPARASDRRVRASSAQEFMWFAVQLDPSGPSYNVPYRLSLTGRLDVEKLELALRDVTDRHQALRTTFWHDGDVLWQLLHPVCAIAMPVTDLRSHPYPDSAAATLADQVARQPFDLTTGPLLRARLIRIDEHRHQLIIVLHHLVFDGWSANIFFAELTAAYNARLAGNEPQFAPLAIQYADFTRWHRDWQSGPQLAPLLAYWRRHLDGAPHVLRLPPAPRPIGDDGVHRVRIPDELAEAVRSLSRAERCTLFMTMLTAYAVTLGQHSGQRDIVIGSPAANRPRPETAGLVGLFVNMLPLRADLTGEPTYRMLLARMKEVVLSGFDHQAPMEEIITTLRPAREPGRSPLFQVIFWLQPQQTRQPRFADCEVAIEELFNGVAKYDLALGVRETSDGLICDFTYRCAALGPDTVDRLATDYLRVLQAMVDDPDSRPILVAADANARPAGPDETRQPSTVADAAAWGELEETIAAIWRSVLDIERVGRYDNFFDLGGHSRLMLQVRNDLSDALGIELTMLDLFEYPTVSALAGFLAKRRAEAAPADATTYPGAGGHGVPGHAETVAAQQRAGRLRLKQAKGRAE